MRADSFMMVTRSGNTLPGESTDDELDDLIEILSFALEIDTVEQRDHGHELGHLVVEHFPLRVVRPVDNVSPKLHDYLNKGYDNLDVTINLLRRDGLSTDNSDAWERKELMSLELSNAQVVSVRVVADPSIQYLPQQSVYAKESLWMGPLEEVLFSYGEIEYSYGTTANKMTWTHPKYLD